MLEHTIVQVVATYADKRKFEGYMKSSPDWVGWSEEDPDELLEAGKEVLFLGFKTISDLVITGYGSCLSFDAAGIGWYETLYHYVDEIRETAVRSLKATYFKDQISGDSFGPGTSLFFLLVKSWVDTDSFEIQDLKIITAEELAKRLFNV